VAGSYAVADVVLIYPKTGLEISTHVRAPLSILTLGTTLKRNGYSVSLIDTRLTPEQRIVEEAKEAILVGISSMTGLQIYHALRASEMIRQANPSVPIVWGGVHPTLLPEQTIRDPRVDIVVRGEGEQTIIELARALEGNRSLDGITGITYKDGDKILSNPDRPFIDLNTLLPLAWELLDRYVDEYILSTPWIFVGRRVLDTFTSRGCTHRCAFCYNPVFHKRKHRFANPEKVLEEFQLLVGRYRLDGLSLGMDDNTFVVKSRIQTICELMVKNLPDIRWRGDCRVDDLVNMPPDLLKVMSKSGCISLLIGAESGSIRILDLIKKDITPEQIVESARVCAKYNIIPSYEFLMGLPTETYEDLMQTKSIIDQILMVNPNAPIMINIYHPYPGSELYELAKKHGLKEPSSLEEWCSSPSWMEASAPWLEDKQRDFLERFSFMSYFLSALKWRGLKVPYHFKAAAKLFTIDAKLRWRLGKWGCAPEWDLMRRYYRKRSMRHVAL